MFVKELKEVNLFPLSEAAGIQCSRHLQQKSIIYKTTSHLC